MGWFGIGPMVVANGIWEHGVVSKREFHVLTVFFDRVGTDARGGLG